MRLTIAKMFGVLLLMASYSSLQALELETAEFAGFLQADVGSPLEVGQIIYDSTTGGTLGAFSSTDLGATFGDAITTVGTGVLSEFTLSVFNSATANTMPITAADVTVDFFAGDETAIGASLGSFTGSFNLTSPLAPGTFTFITYTGLESLNIDLNVNDVVVTQQLSNIQGGSVRAGVISAVPVGVGSSFPGIYIEASTVNMGTPGFYNITSGGVPVDFDLGYQVSVVPEPASAVILMLGGLLGIGILRRR